MNAEYLTHLKARFLSRNYNYLWLKTMLDKGRTTTIPGSTLITGSSYALNGIYERAWKNAINCSMHSQDLYYDFQCARRVISSTKNCRFKRCFIITAYYGAFHDVSLSKEIRKTWVSDIWYPIFHDAHNWDQPVQTDPWAAFENVPEQIRTICENVATNTILKSGTYYPDFRPRPPCVYLNGRTWSQASEEERRSIGYDRSKEHNTLFKHKASMVENKRIFQDFVRFLYSYNVTPIVVITPFTEEYNHGILREMKESMLELLDSVPEYIHYVDFNEITGLFELEDFMDPDHLSAAGAKKMSTILVDMFGP